VRPSVFILELRCINAHWARSHAWSEMRLKMSRRGVYVATIVACLAMVGGFAVAALYNGFTSTAVTNTNVGTVGSSLGNTIYQAGFTVTLAASSAAPAGCQSGNIAGSAPVSGVETDLVYVAGAAASCPTTSEWYEEINFSSVSDTLSSKDTFTFATNGGGSATSSFTLTLHGTETSELLTVFVDDGPASTTPVAITSLTVAVTGN
jgi:hypothetical protein